MNRLLIIPLICVPSFWAEPCHAGVTRDVSKILVGLALVYTAYICFLQARTAATNLAVDPAVTEQLRNNPFTRKLLEIVPEKTVMELMTNAVEKTKVAMSTETTQLRIAKLCGWSLATIGFAYTGLAEFLSGLRGDCVR